MNYRMVKATELLKLTQLSISEISNAVGYANPLHFRVLSKMYMGNRQESGVRITGHNIKNPGDHSPGLPYLLHCRNIDQCQFFNICIFKTGDQRLSGIDRCQYIDTCLNSVSSDDKSGLWSALPPVPEYR